MPRELPVTMAVLAVSLDLMKFPCGLEDGLAIKALLTSIRPMNRYDIYHA
jgi:hypothetical protein